MRYRTAIVGIALAAATVFPLAGTAHAYHCYSDVIGDCSAPQHALENVKENLKDTYCLLLEKATLGTVTC